MRPSIRVRHFVAASLVGMSIYAASALADEAATIASDASAATDAHSHPQASGTSDIRRSEAEYSIPDVTLVREDGKSVALPAELDDGRPVILNFVYTSCTTICPMSSQVFQQFQEDLGSARETVHLVSISIDPEQDTPVRLRAYARQFHAANGWNHYSGSIGSIIAVQRAFNAYRGDKMSHVPLTLLRAGPGQAWVRLDGFARAEDLLAVQRAWSAAPLSLVSR
jgi:protein SCO1